MLSRITSGLRLPVQCIRLARIAKPSLLRFSSGFSVISSPMSSMMYSTSNETTISNENLIDEVYHSTEDRHIIQLSQYVMNDDLEESLKEYSRIPLFLPRSDFRIVCLLMQQLGERCGIPDLNNVFTKIQKMKLSRKHALTFRCLIRLACEMKNPELIKVFYTSVLDEEVYINNSFLNDITLDCLFSIEAYPTICSIFESIQMNVDKGFVLPSFNNHSSQNAITAFISEGRDDLLLFFLQRVKSNWRIPVVITDYIVSNAVRNPELSRLFDKCIASQPKSATLINSVIDYYIQNDNAEMAISSIQKANQQDVKVTSVSYKNVCELLLVMNGQGVSKESVSKLCKSICTLSRGGYIVLLGLSPLEMMLAYDNQDYALKYLQLLKEYDNGLVKKDIAVLEDLKKRYGKTKAIDSGLDQIVSLIQRKYEC